MMTAAVKTSPALSIHPGLSIIVPLLNEIELLPELLAHLQLWQRQGCEVLLVDGGSSDGTAEVAAALGFSVLHSTRGRALQMNAGAAQAKAKVLLFLHADTRLPQDALAHIDSAITQHSWGRFNVQITGESLMLKVVAFFINWRSRLSAIATGDQAIFVDKATFIRIGGFPVQPLMEDVEICKRLKKMGRPACLQARVKTSGRRWMQYGVWRTITLMWQLRFAYWRGVPAEQLAKRYH